MNSRPSYLPIPSTSSALPLRRPYAFLSLPLFSACGIRAIGEPTSLDVGRIDSSGSTGLLGGGRDLGMRWWERGCKGKGPLHDSEGPLPRRVSEKARDTIGIDLPCAP